MNDEIKNGPLHGIIAAYLEGVGFTSYIWQPEGQVATRLWGHPALGNGRTFLNALMWAMGCEYEGRDLRAEALKATGINPRMSGDSDAHPERGFGLSMTQ